MNKKLQKSLHDYLSKIKKPATQLHLHHLPPKTLSSSTSCIIRGCKHPKTPSFAGNVKEKEAHETGNAATLSDIDRFLLENFSSLYDQEENNDDDKGKKCDNDDENSGAVLFESPTFLDLPEKFHDSRRFFVHRSSSGSIAEEARKSTCHVQVGDLGSGHDNRGLGSGRDSIGGLDSGRDSMTTSEDLAYSSTSTSTPAVNDSKRTDQSDDDEDEDDNKDASMAADDFITLLTYSTDPYDDFKQSMHEMVQARLHFHGELDWEFMAELLRCYLNLNDKKSYKFILNAFVDLVVVLREDSGIVPVKSRNVPGGRNGRFNASINKSIDFSKGRCHE